LAIIAVNALLQAALVIGLAIGIRKAADLLDQLQAQFDRQVKPTLDTMHEVTGKAVLVSDTVLERARKLDSAIEGATEKLMETTDRLSEALTGAAGRLQSASSRRIPRPRGRAFAILRSLWRAVEVWGSFEEEPVAPRRGVGRG